MTLGFTIENSNVFNAIFAPIAKKFAFELQTKGIHIFFADQNVSQKFPRLIFGAHSNPGYWLENKTKGDIFVNFEPTYLPNWQINNYDYMKLLNTSRVFNYTKKSQNFLNKTEFFTLPPLYNSKKILPKENDVLFIGSINERRKLIFRELFNDGVYISLKFKIFGDELFKQIEKSKVFLDVNYDSQYSFNIYRFCLCADTNTIYVGEYGDTSDYPEVEELLGLTIANNAEEISKIVKGLISDESHRMTLIKKQRKIANKLNKKFKTFINSFSKEFH